MNIGGRGNTKKEELFFFTRNQPLPVAQNHLIPLFWLKIRDSAPHPGSSFPFFQPTIETPPHEEEPLFLLIPDYTIEEDFFPIFLFPHSSGQRPTVASSLGFSSSPPQPATRDGSLSFKKTKPGQPPPRWKIFCSSCQPRAWLFGDDTQSSPSQTFPFFSFSLPPDNPHRGSPHFQLLPRCPPFPSLGQDLTRKKERGGEERKRGEGADSLLVFFPSLPVPLFLIFFPSAAGNKGQLPLFQNQTGAAPSLSSDLQQQPQQLLVTETKPAIPTDFNLFFSISDRARSPLQSASSNSGQSNNHNSAAITGDPVVYGLRLFPHRRPQRRTSHDIPLPVQRRCPLHTAVQPDPPPEAEEKKTKPILNGPA